MESENTINLFEVGCLINLRVSRWGGRKMLTRADLLKVGYDPDALPVDLVNLGRKLMIPKEELAAITQIEQRARKILEKWSVPFGIANSHFVPIKMLPSVEQQLQELKDEFFQRIDSLIVRFDKLVSTVKGQFPEFWEKCLKGHYPRDPQTLRGKFAFQWFTFRIAGLNSIEETSATEIITEQKIINEKEQELRKQMQDEVSRFVKEYVTSMRQETVKFCDLMTARINGKPFGEETESKKLTPRSIGCFRKYVDRFKEMNIFEDNEVEKMLDEFKTNFLNSGIGPKDFESANVKNGITKVLESIRLKADTDGSSENSFIDEIQRKVIL